MYWALGLLATIIGIVYLAMALRDGYASDRAGRVLAPRHQRPVAYWTHVFIFALLASVGIGLLIIASGA